MPRHTSAREKFSGAWWAGYVRDIILPTVQTYHDCVSKRMLRSFDTLNEEVDRRARALYSSASVGEDDDGSSAAEWASDEAFNWGAAVGEIYNASIGLFTAGLFHLFEQHAGFILREGPRPYGGGADAWVGKPASLSQFREWLKLIGIEATDVPQWNRIYGELRHVANVVKHAEGSSALELRKCRPDLFAPSFGGKRSIWNQYIVRKPLAGDGLYVTERDFRRYVAAVRAFWKGLARRFDGLPLDSRRRK